MGRRESLSRKIGCLFCSPIYKRTNGVESLVTATDVPAMKVNPQKWQGSPVVWRNIYVPGRDQVTGAIIECFIK